MIPTISQIYQSFSNLTFNSIVLDKLYNQRKLSYRNDPQADEILNQIVEIDSNYRFLFEQVSYKYRSSLDLVLEDISLSFESPVFIGIVGSTGSGKSTFIDLLLGLLRPTSGIIYLNEKEFNQFSRKEYSSRVGYVPQEIYLMDDTVSKNIALGVDENSIDLDRVVTAAKIADIDEFISNNLDEGYSSIVGERGAKLSGGQVQRIGIARALYNNPAIMILDEGTSNLDQKTEAKILNNLSENKEIKILIIVAHRLITTERCDELLLFKDGKLHDRGSFKELSNRNQYFKQMIDS